MKKASVSMKQIAAEAGVSMMTVSRVLRNEGNVAPTTEASIRAIADRLGYKPNRLVRGMQSGRSGIVSVVVPSGHAVAPQILEGAYDFLHDKDMIMALDIVHGNVGDRAFAEQSKVINRLLESRVDGVILLPVNEEASPMFFQEMIDRKIPIVLVDRNTTHFVADFVGTDDYAGGYEAARILADNGCKQAVLISTGGFVSTSRLRSKGFREGLEAFNVNLVEEIIAPNFTHNAEFIDRELSKINGQFDAVFGIADRLAISAWHSCQQLNLKIPQQVKVIGFGALNLRDPRVALSSFDQEPYKVGQNAAQLLVDRIEKGPWKRRPKPKTILLKPKFVEGTSCPE
ncbi:LacI family DNA-binding transcriptional regulator [Coraliomargarita sp. SDUM461003]|uniref:LacI family DNA-binding transcriptional regulator n=1 Tax=Thalassobacterium maritimum TaxID=3041265 RepID=A0ABU1ARF2_9BACT|nr:LacI family DNA-binding transcriptional regulator [Coraliomargarita sp. SDUM461003]MDQ8206731.1 LacI family DNA-binding transcriptional regulator [Coraliomargarita sp. SDUM461003]